MQKTLRLSKRMADLSICSRREADDLIAKGLVLVNGQKVDVLGYKVSLDDEIELSPAAKNILSKKFSIALNKPVGYVSHATDEDYPEALGLITKENYHGDLSDLKDFKTHKLKGLAPAGRLDIDSKGLIIFTQNGVLARKIIGDLTLEKEYLVKLNRDLNKNEESSFQRSMSLDGKKLRPTKLKRLSEALYEVILTEGKKRQIRRMFENLGAEVYSLKRLRIGNLDLGDLPEGKWAYVVDEDIL